MPSYTVMKEVDVRSGRDCLSSFDVRLTFTVTKGVKARTWANAADGFHPAEDPTVDITSAEVMFHKANGWMKVEGIAFDMACADVTPEWLLAQIEADEVAA